MGHSDGTMQDLKLCRKWVLKTLQSSVIWAWLAVKKGLGSLPIKAIWGQWTLLWQFVLPQRAEENSISNLPGERHFKVGNEWRSNDTYAFSTEVCVCWVACYYRSGSARSKLWISFRVFLKLLVGFCLISEERSKCKQACCLSIHIIYRNCMGPVCQVCMGLHVNYAQA